MIHMKAEITVLAGVKAPAVHPREPFSESALEFLEALSKMILAPGEQIEPEIAAFGFWCRRAHLARLKERHKSGAVRLGKGLVFHAAPSNVPMVFAYSLAIGILAGNSNIVRVSDRSGPAAWAVCALLKELLADSRFFEVRESTSIVSYGRDDTVTAGYMSLCDAAVVWGGDGTVQAMRRFPRKPGAELIAFPNRWSMALFSQRTLTDADDETLRGHIHRFFVDTYVMDQNACSSPSLVLWLRDGGGEAVRERFWQGLAREAERARYPMDAFRAVGKYQRALLTGARERRVTRLRRFGGNLLYVLTLEGPPEDPDALQGGFGLFYQAEIDELSDVMPFVTEKLQTVGVLGIDKAALARCLADRGARGADRIVETGQALEMDTIWDGKDLIERLSREIYVL